MLCYIVFLYTLIFITCVVTSMIDEYKGMCYDKASIIVLLYQTFFNILYVLDNKYLYEYFNHIVLQSVIGTIVLIDHQCENVVNNFSFWTLLATTMINGTMLAYLISIKILNYYYSRQEHDMYMMLNKAYKLK